MRIINYNSNFCKIARISKIYETLKINLFPFRTLSFLFVIYNNSDYATIGKSAGFFCDDESIMKPFQGDSIRATYLFVVLLGIFAIIVFISELLHQNQNEKQVQNTAGFRCRLNLKHYYSGFLYVLAITEILKVFYSELRPHFFYTCLPDMSNIDCSKGLITQFNCTGKGSRWLVDRDIYKSFPSGHAALSVYAFIFITVYLYSKRGTKSNSLSIWWTRVIPPLCFLWAVACCVSRILDNRHFWWDVLTGVFIGLIGGLITVYIALNKALQIRKKSSN